MSFLKDLFGFGKKQRISLETFSQDLIRPIDTLPDFINQLNSIGKPRNADQVYSELVIAFLFSVTYPVEVALFDSPIKDELLDHIHFKTYALLKHNSKSFDGVEFEKRIESRYQEFRSLIKKQRPDDVFLKLAEAIVYHIDDNHVRNTGYISALGVWIGNCMVENKKFIDKVIQQCELC